MQKHPVSRMSEARSPARSGPTGQLRFSTLCIAAAAILQCSGRTLAADATVSDYGPLWTQPSRLDAFTTYNDPTGKIGVLFTDGPVDTKGHPFFAPRGPAGRSCSTCHAPENGMSLSTESLQARWKRSGVKDPAFASVDGSNCPDLDPSKESSHSLLLTRGVFRISRPWPPRDPEGKVIEPEFTVEVVRDPTGCNTSADYGLTSAHPHISVYRRPRVVGNLRYITNEPNDRRFGVSAKTGFAIQRTPDGKGSYSLNLTADSRVLSLRDQAESALGDHMPGARMFSDGEMDTLLRFMQQIYVAQVGNQETGDLLVRGSPPGLGPYALSKGLQALDGDAIDTPVFQSFKQWEENPTAPPTTADAEFRASVARGSNLFGLKQFLVRDVNGINTVGLGNPVKRDCALCHNMQMTGQDQVPGWMDIGSANWPWAKDNADLPQFKLTCRQDVKPDPYLGRVVYTTDPGRALETGRCADIGMITIQQLRGLSARAPYFSNGSAKTLRAVVDFYDRRFQIGFTEQEKQDLVNFLSVL